MGLKTLGFTLIELVIVIIVLSAIGIATSSYIATGVGIYTDISERDSELSSTRFVMERLRRDILNALPNSLVVSDDTQCLTFTPIIKSSIYGYDFPIYPLNSTSASIATIEDYSYENGDKAAVYVLSEAELSDSALNTGQVHEISSVSSEVITFKTTTSFSLSSPSNRLYIIRDTQQYCFSGNSIYLTIGDESPVLMANDIEGTFDVSQTTLQRNGLAKVRYTLDFGGQEVPIEQTLHVNNVP